jgi:hypothetical protein
MKIFGVDFTSSPSAAKTKGKTAKGLTLVECNFDGECLAVERMTFLNGTKAGDFTGFEEWLRCEGAWAGEKEWVAAIDFPFGMPIEAIEHFGWLSGGANQSWDNYVRSLHHNCESAESFRACIEGWRHASRTNENGEPIRIRKQRLVDRLANSGSPMNYFPPPVCPMFYQGGKRIHCASSVSIVPVRPILSGKIVLEAYPRLVANVFIGAQASYKDKSKKKHEDKVAQTQLRDQDEAAKRKNREQIVVGLKSDDPNGQMRRRYDCFVSLSDAVEAECIADNDGDKLDSVLCAVQAAWASKTPRYGMPQFTLSLLNEQVGLEGWIADPIVLERFDGGES